MAVALNFDGVNDYLTFPVWVATDDFKLVFPAQIKGGGSRVWFYDTNNTSSVGRQSNNGLTVITAGGRCDWTSFFVDDVELREITIERIGGLLSVYIDGVQFKTSQANTGTLTLDVYGRDKWDTYIRAIEMEGFELTDLTTPSNSRLYSASASNHGAGNPTLVDTLGGFDASGVGMPTDGSAWVGALPPISTVNNLQYGGQTVSEVKYYDGTNYVDVELRMNGTTVWAL